MGFLALNLSNQLGRLVLDKTGFTGNYDFDLKWTPDMRPASAYRRGRRRAET
jgi:uncharacterized protein (TIGR03435 family)